MKKEVVAFAAAALFSALSTTAAGACGNAGDDSCRGATSPSDSQKIVESARNHGLLARLEQDNNLKILDGKDLGSIYELVIEGPAGKALLYLTKDNRYLLYGVLVDDEGNNMTRERQEALNKVDISLIPFDDAIKTVKGSGEKKIVMITDVDCPFCRKAQAWLYAQTDYTLHSFLFPLDIHPEAYNKSIRILCAANPADALREVKEGKSIDAEMCQRGEEKLKRHKEIAKSLGVTGTPLFILEDGVRISGFDRKRLKKIITKMN